MRTIAAMATVELTRHLYTYFPKLQGAALEIEGARTVAEVLAGLEARAPGLGFYICDERGRLRRHVNIFIDEQMITDRVALSDAVGPDTRVMIMQALSGG